MVVGGEVGVLVGGEVGKVGDGVFAGAFSTGVGAGGWGGDCAGGFVVGGSISILLFVSLARPR